MKGFDQLLQEDIGKYEGRHDDLIFQAPAFYRLFTNLLDDPRLPLRRRPLVLAVIAYFVLPADIIPESLEGPYGYIDDIWLCAFVASKLQEECGKELLLENWDGEAPLPPLMDDLLKQEKEILGEKKSLVLKYIGFDQLII
jgi:uncharacterized membrane protein YkvA (DUF1232 family)